VKISVTVKPNSRVEEVTKDGEKLLVKVKEPPKEGKANRAVIKLLSAYFGVPQNSVSIISGLGSKNKVIEVSGI
jgi:uncharacterized protein